MCFRVLMLASCLCVALCSMHIFAGLLGRIEIVFDRQRTRRHDLIIVLVVVQQTAVVRIAAQTQAAATNDMGTGAVVLPLIIVVIVVVRLGREFIVHGLHIGQRGVRMQRVLGALLRSRHHRRAGGQTVDDVHQLFGIEDAIDVEHGAQIVDENLRLHDVGVIDGYGAWR